MNLHSPSFILIHLHSNSFTFIHTHPSSLIFIYLHRPSITFASFHLHLPSSSSISLHLPSLAFIHGHLHLLAFFCLHTPTSTTISLHLPSSTHDTPEIIQWNVVPSHHSFLANLFPCPLIFRHYTYSKIILHFRETYRILHCFVIQQGLNEVYIFPIDLTFWP